MLSKTPHFALHSCVIATLDPADLVNSLFASHEVWLGAMVPKRWAKRAVTRNVIKRQVYNVSAALEATLQRRAHVVRLRAAFDRTQFKSASSDALNVAVRSELFQLFNTAHSPSEKLPKSGIARAALT